MSANCSCKRFCESHGREFVGISEGFEYCNECAADGFDSQLVTPCPDSASSTNGKPTPSDLEEMEYMCDQHKNEKMAFIFECAKL